MYCAKNMTLSNATTNQRNCRQNTTEEERKQNLFLHCAHLVLPWLTPAELANASLTCKTLLQISKSITLSRSLDASRSFENLAIPFHNTADNIPYAYFIYTPSQIIASSCSQSLQRQFWGSSDAAESNSMRLLGLESVSRMDDTVESVSGCECENCFEVGHGNELFGCPCFSGLEDVGIVSECGPSCACGPECENRLTQRGISVRLKIVRDVKTGWGLYADQLIQQGQFICEYAGIRKLQIFGILENVWFSCSDSCLEFSMRVIWIIIACAWCLFHRVRLKLWFWKALWHCWSYFLSCVW